MILRQGEEKDRGKYDDDSKPATETTNSVIRYCNQVTEIQKKHPKIKSYFCKTKRTLPLLCCMTWNGSPGILKVTILELKNQPDLSDSLKNQFLLKISTQRREVIMRLYKFITYRAAVMAKFVIPFLGKGMKHRGESVLICPALHLFSWLCFNNEPRSQILVLHAA